MIVNYAGANVNSVKFHEMALHHAARVGMVEMIELLVEFGANVYASDNLGRKPIDYTTPASPSYTCLRFYESKVLRCLTYSKNIEVLTFLLFFLLLRPDRLIKTFVVDR